MDPEDVEAVLRPYHDRVRAELERHGGTVEKFIGDAVVALFGAPVAHEDDPERAVRAALAIRDYALEEGVELRIAVTTGEALVSLGARPGRGEGMASGDVVNTAARLQNAAPVNGILVDETTFRATRPDHQVRRRGIRHRKGQGEPSRGLVARRSARSRFGVDVAHEARAELVGRERELGVLRDAFARARHDRTPQLVTLVGVPGIGKSRLVYELVPHRRRRSRADHLAAGPLPRVRGGVTLWALGEIVKAQAGILEQDPPAEVTEKIRRVVAETLAGHGRRALGRGAPARSRRARRKRQSSAAIAETRRSRRGGGSWRRSPNSARWSSSSRTCTGRTRACSTSSTSSSTGSRTRRCSSSRRPGRSSSNGARAGAAASSTRRRWRSRPSRTTETARLIGGLLGTPAARGRRTADAARAGRRETLCTPSSIAELFLERGSAEELPLPETLQGIIAARLDGLPGSEKELLRNAAVVGKVFWASALDGEAAGRDVAPFAGAQGIRAAAETLVARGRE